MLTALDFRPETLDDHERQFVDTVREFGWFRTNVLEETEHIGFTYSTGWWLSINHPELVIFGIKSEIAGNVLWDLYREALAGGPVEVGVRTDRAFNGLPAYAFEVSPEFYPEYLGWSRWFYGGDNFRCLQLVWPDPEGRFPWEDEADPSFSKIQPDLTKSGWRASVKD
jgi:hypothetical protein